MTRIDDRTDGVEVDAAALDRLAAALDRPGVVAASLVGSQATGRAGPLSDVDLGVWVEPALDARERLDLQLALVRAAAGALGSEAVDVIVLNDASPLMRHRALRDGRRIVERDRAARVRAESAALVEFLDTAELRAELARGLRHRMEEDRFGRP